MSFKSYRRIILLGLIGFSSAIIFNAGFNGTFKAIAAKSTGMLWISNRFASRATSPNPLTFDSNTLLQRLTQQPLVAPLVPSLGQPFSLGRGLKLAGRLDFVGAPPPQNQVLKQTLEVQRQTLAQKAAPPLAPVRVSAPASALEQNSGQNSGQNLERGLKLVETLDIAGAEPPQYQVLKQTLERGLKAYEAEQFAEAITLWQQALATASTDSDQDSVRAAIWNYLSLAYQQLGRWPEAEAAIRSGLSQLGMSDLASGLADTNPADRVLLAKLLNTQGRWYWYRSQPEQALESWEQAASAYQTAGDRTGLAISLINQARVLQTLGFSVRAEAQLLQVEALVKEESDLSLKAIGLRDLGNAFRRVGKLQESRQMLQASLELANQRASEPASSSAAGVNAGVQSAIYLDLGNTERAIGNKALAIGDSQTAQTQFQQAVTAYQQAVTLAPTSMTALQSQLNQFSLWIETDRAAEANALSKTLQSQLEALPPNHSSLYVRLNYAQTLSKQFSQQFSNNQGTDQAVDLAKFLAQTLQQAQSLGDLTAESYALGQLGALYEQTGQKPEAEALTRQALLKAEALQAADIRYRWEWQLGRLQQQQGNLTEALVAYQAAVKSLQAVRNDLLAIGAEVQFSFRDDVEPVYRGLVELLLSADLANANKTPSQDNLKQAIQQVNALQLAELNNFLGCNLAQVVAIGDVKTDPTAAKLYPMILPNRLAVVLERPGEQPLLFHEVVKPRAEILATLQQLRQNLSASDRTPEAIAGLSELNQWLIAPFQSELSAELSATQTPIQTLVFVLDAELRNVPMAALYDAAQQQYLVSRYAIAVAPRLELFQPSPRPAQFDLFLGGIGEPQTLADRAFPKIEYLTPELEQIQTIVKAKTPLLNANFTETNLEQQLQSGNFSAVHLKTHGIFSSDPEETFIVAYQELITGRDLGRLIQLGRLDSRLGEASAIELLVLSACSTAQGDSRAVLGLAGIAVQAGARSVVSTLWEAQDLPNTELMIRFYQALLDPQISRAEALRQAQLHLLAQGYTTPHVWATYVLVGNWL
jgi:CHAT domain-containing protein